MTQSAKRAQIETGGIKARALDAAATLLAEHGADDLSLRAIAETAGIGLASIYHYFENKDELLLSLALMGFDDLRRDIVTGQADPEFGSPMRGSARAFFAFAQLRPALFSLMFSERLMTRHRALREAERGALDVYIAAVKADDRIPPHHQENAAHGLWALGRGMAAIIASHPSGQVPPELLQRMFAGAGYLINHPD